MHKKARPRPGLLILENAEWRTGLLRRTAYAGKAQGKIGGCDGRIDDAGVVDDRSYRPFTAQYLVGAVAQFHNISLIETQAL